MVCGGVADVLEFVVAGHPVEAAFAAFGHDALFEHPVGGVDDVVVAAVGADVTGEGHGVSVSCQISIWWLWTATEYPGGQFWTCSRILRRSASVVMPENRCRCMWFMGPLAVVRDGWVGETLRLLRFGCCHIVGRVGAICPSRIVRR